MKSLIKNKKAVMNPIIGCIFSLALIVFMYFLFMPMMWKFKNTLIIFTIILFLSGISSATTNLALGKTVSYGTCAGTGWAVVPNLPSVVANVNFADQDIVGGT